MDSSREIDELYTELCSMEFMPKLQRFKYLLHEYVDFNKHLPRREYVEFLAKYSNHSAWGRRLEVKIRDDYKLSKSHGTGDADFLNHNTEIKASIVQDGQNNANWVQLRDYDPGVTQYVLAIFDLKK